MADDFRMAPATNQEAPAMSDLARIIENAEELLDASRGQLDQEDYDHRRSLIDEARQPRVAYMTRMRLLDDALEGLYDEVQA